METERAPGSLALMTRGPDGSAVRSNIGAMVQERRRRSGRDRGGGREFGRSVEIGRPAGLAAAMLPS